MHQDKMDLLDLQCNNAKIRFTLHVTKHNISIGVTVLDLQGEKQDTVLL